MKLSLLNGSDIIKNNIISGEKLTLKFCGKDEKHEPASASFLPIYIHSCPLNFSTVNYFEVSQHFNFFEYSNITLKKQF